MAHTATEFNSSTRVLEKIGMKFACEEERKALWFGAGRCRCNDSGRVVVNAVPERPAEPVRQLPDARVRVHPDTDPGAF
jgi:hypothetical protein